MPQLIDGSRRQRIAARQRHDRPAGEPAAERPQADGEDDEADGKGKMPGAPAGSSLAQAQRQGDALRARDRRRTMAVRMRLDPRRVEEEPDLPRRRRRLALSARRQVHRDRRPLQPADRSLDDRARRGQGRDWLGKGAQPTEAVARLIKTRASPKAVAELLAYLARELVDDPEAVRVEDARSARRPRAPPARRARRRRQGDRPAAASCGRCDGRPRERRARGRRVVLEIAD